MTLIAVVEEPSTSFLSHVSVEMILLKKLALLHNTMRHHYFQICSIAPKLYVALREVDGYCGEVTVEVLADKTYPNAY